MVDTGRHPTYLLNRYVWELLKANTSLREADYGNRTPIVPANMEPEFTAYNKPFLVYGYSEDTTPDVYAMRSGALSYAVWSTSVAEINNILNVIRAGMERHDETAKSVNAYTTSLGGTSVGIRFGDIYVNYLEGPSPEESEGGRQAGVITLRYQYFADYGVKTFKDGQWVYADKEHEMLHNAEWTAAPLGSVWEDVFTSPYEGTAISLTDEAVIDITEEEPVPEV